MSSVSSLLRRLWLLFAQAVTVALAVLAVLALWRPALWQPAAWRLPAAPAARSAAPIDSRAPTAAGSLAAAVRRAAPAVVSVAATRLAPGRPGTDPWQRYFGADGRGTGAPTGLGSGVLVAAEGYVLTNAHVVDGADDIEVTLADGRSAGARLVGTDPESDLALLKIALDDLPVIAFGSMDSVAVGDPVLAIGNPFNVGQTVTSGIVSALDRNQLGLSEIENFIQTDAAINPGNSGGALVDAQGRLLGINTALFSRSGGSMGIGFAIPVDIAREVMNGLIRDGRMIRGWIGVQPRDLTAEFADSFQLPVHAGVLVTGVLRGGPAARAGLQPGDVVTAVDGHRIANTAQLLRAIGAIRPSATTTLAVQRDGESLTMKVTVGERSPPSASGRRDTAP